MLYIDIDRYCKYYNAPRNQWNRVFRGTLGMLSSAPLHIEVGYAAMPETALHRFSDWCWADTEKDLRKVRSLLAAIDLMSEYEFNNEKA